MVINSSVRLHILYLWNDGSFGCWRNGRTREQVFRNHTDLLTHNAWIFIWLKVPGPVWCISVLNWPKWIYLFVLGVFFGGRGVTRWTCVLVVPVKILTTLEFLLTGALERGDWQVKYFAVVPELSHVRCLIIPRHIKLLHTSAETHFLTSAVLPTHPQPPPKCLCVYSNNVVKHRNASFIRSNTVFFRL